MSNRVVFSHKAMAKYVFTKYFCNDQVISGSGNSWLECSTYGICDDPKRRNYITDLYIPKQEVSTGYTECDDDDRIDYICGLYDKGLEAWQGNGIWCHTHPGSSSQPSGTDEETWESFFGDRENEQGQIEYGPDFAAMIIMAKDKSDKPFYCRVKCRTDFFPESLMQQAQIFYETAGGNQAIAASMFEVAHQNKGYVQVPELNILFYEVWQHYHKEWLEELKDQVSKRTYTSTGHGYNYGGHGSYSHGSHSSGSHNAHVSHSSNNQKKNVGGKVVKTESETGPRTRVSSDELLSFLLMFDKDSYNAFSKDQRTKLQKLLNCNEHALYEAQKEITSYEQEFTKSQQDVVKLVKEIQESSIKIENGEFIFSGLTGNDWIEMFGENGLRRSFYTTKLNDLKIKGE